MLFNQPGIWMFFSAIVSLAIAALAWKRRGDSAIRTLAYLLMFAAIWSLGYGLELISKTGFYIRLSGFIAYIGIVLTPIFWMLFAARYTQNNSWLTKPVLFIVFAIPALSLISLATNSFHNLFYTSSELRFNGSILYQELVYGPLWLVHAFWSYLAGLSGILFFLKSFYKAKGINKIKNLYFIIGSMIPYIVNIFYINGFKPYGYLDLTPVAFILMGILLVVGSHRISLFDIRPLALDVLFDNLPHPIFVLDEHNRISIVNPAASELIGVLHHDARDRGEKQRDDNEIIQFMLNDALTDFVIGQRIYFRSFSAITENGQNRAGTLMTLHDITKEKNNEKRLMQSEMRFRLILENMPILLNAFDDQGLVIVWNKACEKSTGYSAAEIIGNPSAMQLLYPDERYRQMVKTVSNEKTGNYNTFELVAKNGSKRTITWFDTYHHLQVPGWASWGLGMDVTDQKKTEEALKTSEKQLRELNASKDLFFSIIAHDLRSPFNSILGLSELMMDQIEEQDYTELAKYTELIYNTSRTTYDLLVNLLEWSQTQTGKIEFAPEYIELSAFVEEESNLHRQLASMKGIEINIDFRGKLLAYADRRMLSTVLRNLISNAIKFSFQGSSITISGFRVNKGVGLSVSDQGVGIDAENIDKLFRLEESFSTKGTQNERGTGLGLILCREFVERHGGKIWAESKAGNGSTFTFTLPVLPSDL